jgi:hypothetical protein
MISVNNIYHNNTCDDAMIPLSIWLMVNAIGTMVYTVVMIVSVVALIVDHCRNRDEEQCDITYFSVLFFSLIGTIAFTMFLVVWHIAGMVTLFRDSFDCFEENKPLWLMVMFSILFQWISMFIVWYCVYMEKEIRRGSE